MSVNSFLTVYGKSIKYFMTKRDIPIYDVTLDPNYSESGEDLGIEVISNVAVPAVRIKGFAFNSTEKLRFSTDDLKYRIIAPVLVPDEIYRKDDFEYYLRFSPKVVEEIAMKFMANLANRPKKVFTDDHQEKELDSFIFEAYLIDEQLKKEMIHGIYGLDVPMGSFIIVQQFNNKEQYFKMLEEGKTGFSFEGYLGMALIEEEILKQKFNNTVMNKQKFFGMKRPLSALSGKVKFEEVLQADDLILITDEVKEGGDISVMEDLGQAPIQNYTGVIDANIKGVATRLIIEDGKIVGMEEMKEDEAEVVAEVIETEEVAEVAMEVIEPVVETVAPVIEPEVIAPVVNEDKFTEVYKMIADLKAEMMEDKMPTDITIAPPSSQRFSQALRSFVEWQK